MHTEVLAGFRGDDSCRCPIVCTEADTTRRRSAEGIYVARARELHPAERIPGDAGAVRGDSKSYGEPGGASRKREPGGGTIRGGIDPGKGEEEGHCLGTRRAACAGPCAQRVR